MGQVHEWRWSGRFGSLTITRDKGYFQISVFLGGTLFLLSIAKAENDPTDD